MNVFLHEYFRMMEPGDKRNVNTVEAGGVQGINAVNSSFNNTTVNIGQPEQRINMSQTVAKYKTWVIEEKENSQLRGKLAQLNVNGEICHIERKLKRNGKEFSEKELLKNMPRSKTSLVTGPAGSGKSILATRITVAWAESVESIYDLVLFLSSMDNLPLHKLLWGEYARLIGKDSERIYQELLEIKDFKILVIIDGLGNKQYFVLSG